ncbi:uncharacterized protein [Rutidosis leptorrhynchoides]|uniref:uncharacterized protein n=1 Tax=Rutidosis leptorrhynchoides TaxID=125765 RepID=UPI003A99B99B
MAGGDNKVASSSSAAHHHNKPNRQSASNKNPNPNPNPNLQKPSPSNSKPSPANKHKPSPKTNLNPNPIPGNFAPVIPPLPPPPPPVYGFHMLDRRTIVFADGSARSYFALPPDYQDFPPQIPRAPIRPPGPEPWLGLDRQFPPGRPVPGGSDHYRQQNQDHRNPLGIEGSRKRKLGDEGDLSDEFARQRQQLLQFGNTNLGAGSSGSRNEMRGSKYNEVDQEKLKSAFFNYIRLVNENANQKKKFLADGKQASLQCLACGRSSKDFPDMHSLIMHTYNPEKATSDQVTDHLGLHKALCILMGWNYLMPPDNSKTYQRLSAEEAAAARDDLILWPPHVIIHNTATGKGRDGRMEGLGNKAIEIKLRGYGFTTGKPKSMYGREGHMGTTGVKFSGDKSGLNDAMRLADYFEKQKRGRRSWASVQSMFRPGKEDEKDPNFVKLDKKNGEKERILYGYLGTVFDLDVMDFDHRKKVTVESKSVKAQPT